MYEKFVRVAAVLPEKEREVKEEVGNITWG
jgi:hypothetical protein